MKINTYTLAVLALFALNGCSHGLAESPGALPTSIEHVAGLMPLSGSWVSYTHYLSGDTCCLEVEPDREDLPKGHTLELHLCGKPYSTASGTEWQHHIATLRKPGKYIYKLAANDFRTGGGPYDYCVSFTLRDAKGKELDRRDARLSYHIPGPGWVASYEKENRESLQKLQDAAEHCSAMRLVLTYHEQGIYNTEVELPLSVEDTDELRRLISRMRPIKTYLHEIIPLYHTELIFLDADGREMERMDPHDVTGEQYVSPEDLANLSGYALSRQDAATWNRIVHGPKVKAAIDAAVKKAQENRSKRRHKRR